jgi:hypothetical protein
MWVAEDVPKQISKQIYRFAMRSRMITKRPLDRPQCKRQKRIAAAVSNAERIEAEWTSSRNRKTVAASVRLCIGGQFLSQQILRHLDGFNN